MPSFVANVDPHDRSVVDEVLSAVLAAQSRVRCPCNRAADIYGRSFVVPVLAVIKLIEDHLIHV